MTVYLTGNSGGRTNFMITSAKVWTSIDLLIEELLNSNLHLYKVENLFKSWNVPKVYELETDSNIPAKNISKAKMTKYMKEWAKNNPDKIAKFELLK